MHIIQNNPYRTVGLLVGATAKEQERQIRRLRQYIEVEQEPEEDFCFPSLGEIKRTIESVNEAASKLNLDSDKMNAALFWFYKGNPITDEPALDAIKEADIDQAINIWKKLTSTEVVTQRNSSAFSNLSTLYLSSVKGGGFKSFSLGQGISLKLKFLESDFAKDIKAFATDETYKATKKDLQLLFLNQVQSEIETNNCGSLNKLLDIINKQEFTAKEDFLKGFVQKPIEQIEKNIEEAKIKRKASKANTLIIAESFHKHTAENLKQLKSILGVSNMKYASIADKVANEILQCSIDYFNYYQENESDIDYFEPAWKLTKLAETIAIGKLVKDRIVDSLKTLDEMKDKEISQAIQLLQSVKDAYDKNKAEITAKVKEQERTDYEIILGKASINWSKVNQVIENSIDWDNVVSLILEVIPHKNVDKIKNIQNATKVNEYKSLVDFVLGKLNYSLKNKVQYICYWKTASTLRPTTSSSEKLYLINDPKSTSTHRPTTSSSSSSRSGCYIATMAYGDYDHPQVVVLRQFRDEVLYNSIWGRLFINIYYRISPIMVEKLKEKKKINQFIRNLLDKIILQIKKTH